jgi:hypothetical protein
LLLCPSSDPAQKTKKKNLFHGMLGSVKFRNHLCAMLGCLGGTEHCMQSIDGCCSMFTCICCNTYSGHDHLFLSKPADEFKRDDRIWKSELNYVGDELDAELDHAFVGAVLEYDVVRRGGRLQKIPLAALRDDLADVHPAEHQTCMSLTRIMLMASVILYIRVPKR